MNKQRVIMTSKELKRLQVVQEMSTSRITGAQAAELLGLSVRQVRRLVARYREQGAAGLAHGNRGKVSPRRVSGAVREQIVKLVKERYRDYNTQHLVEVLAERHQLQVSYATLRRIRNGEGLPSPRKRRAPKYRQRRERYRMAGMLLQTDGSDHDWLEGRGPGLTLIAYIDDATNEVPAAVFREQEDAAGYMLGLQQLGQTHGLPLALYGDQHTIFRSPKEPTLEQQLAGEEPKSQFGRALDELGIQYIAAYSPQAKGRVERLFETLQDRLVKALREAGASNCREANQVLVTFLPNFNRRFMTEAAQPGSAYRQWPADLRPSDVLCFKYTRTVANDNTISFDGHKLQIPPGPRRISYARARVEVRQHLDHSLAVHYQAELLATFEAADGGPLRVGKFTPAALPAPSLPLQAPPPSATQASPPPPAKPAVDHPWRRSYKQGWRYNK
jgi:transposase